MCGKGGTGYRSGSGGGTEPDGQGVLTMLQKTKFTAFVAREDEPAYARVPLVAVPEKNRYGKPIQLVDENDELAGQSLRINGDAAVGDNPNRHKQHGFYFNADNCISCHACESACSEKNDLPPHLAFRSVGYVEGGSYPDYTRLNISMACNHCDDPVCLKGCPTRAYTKFAEYGAVLQDPDICFGCGYCTWVCPYNAPQLDTKAGHVQKCNMCVDRLEAGLKPACVSACLGGALDFGVIETTPENRDQLNTSIPGFPEPEITHPNIRFQQTRTLPAEMVRTDSIPLRYERDEHNRSSYKAKVRESRRPRQWNLKALLGSHENAHIAFTVSYQMALGAFLLYLLGPLAGIDSLSASTTGNIHLPLMAVLLVVLSFGLLKLNLHLGKPHRFYRGFNNLRWSPVSREIAGVSLFFAGMSGYALLSMFDNIVATYLARAAALVAVPAGLLGLYYMYRLYRIPARPFWNHWQTGTAFTGTTLVMGSILLGLVSAAAQGLAASGAIIDTLAPVILTGLLTQAVGLMFHARDMKATGGEGAASYYEQSTRYGKSYIFHNVLMMMNILVAALLSVYGLSGYAGVAIGSMFGISLLAMTIISRALFYVLVIPTTMPGAFFWRNRGFQEHARQVGLARMPQVGVLPERHH
jgi:DMSO reductase iron-sulfur subunit